MQEFSEFSVTDNISDKQILLNQTQNLHTQPNGIEFKHFIYVTFMMAISLALLLPKIYIINKIYYESIEITKIANATEILIEENRELNSKLEKMRFKNQILNPLLIP